MLFRDLQRKTKDGVCCEIIVEVLSKILGARWLSSWSMKGVAGTNFSGSSWQRSCHSGSLSSVSLALGSSSSEIVSSEDTSSEKEELGEEGEVKHCLLLGFAFISSKKNLWGLEQIFPLTGETKRKMSN